MHILALNFGTATLKYALFAGAQDRPVRAGVLERPSSVTSGLRHVHDDLDSMLAPDAIALRVVHGGTLYTNPTLIDDEVEHGIAAQLPLAPSHNAMALQALRAARGLWPRAPQVAVFDTAFHAGMPLHASTYAVPTSWREAGLRRYGFHGLSHQHVAEAVARRMHAEPAALRIISCHLGHGASVCAIAQGRSVDTSMGLTPLEGLIMGTRSGDLDPGATAYVARTLGLTLEQIERLLYRESGMAALAGQGGDLRSIEAAAAAGDAVAQEALVAYAYRIRKYIGSYAAAMGGCDAVAFTGGVGEHSAGVRARVLAPLGFLGLKLDASRNGTPELDEHGVAELQDATAPLPVLVVAAREEWVLAREARRLLEGT